MSTDNRTEAIRMDMEDKLHGTEASPGPLVLQATRSRCWGTVTQICSSLAIPCVSQTPCLNKVIVVCFAVSLPLPAPHSFASARLNRVL